MIGNLTGALATKERPKTQKFSGLDDGDGMGGGFAQVIFGPAGKIKAPSGI